MDCSLLRESVLYSIAVAFQMFKFCKLRKEFFFIVHTADSAFKTFVELFHFPSWHRSVIPRMHLSFCQQRGEEPGSFWLKASVLLQLSEVVQSEKQQKYDVWMLKDSENDINIVYGSLG